MSSLLDPETLKFYLEWAGARLVAMPGQKVKPNGSRVIWPDYSQDKFEVLNFRGDIEPRAIGPSKEEIPIMDDILMLPNVCSHDGTRRTLHMRAIVHPINGRYLYKWTRIAAKLGVKPRVVKIWHKRGLDEVLQKTDSITLDRICIFMKDNLDKRFTKFNNISAQL